MSIPELCIKRPVFAIVINLFVLLLGYVCYDRLTVREYPNIDVPVVTVETFYGGASAKIIETQVTKPLEEQLSGIEGVDFIKSISRAESSQITVQFRLERDADAAASDVRDRVGRARDNLPDEVDEPIVAKVEADAQPIIWLALSSDTDSELVVSEYADLIVQDRLQTLPGIASVVLFAERRYSMRIWLDRDRLAAYQMTAADVERALRAQNVEIPSGRIESLDREFTVLTETDLNTPTQFEKVILRSTEQGHLVRLRDVARVAIGSEEERQIARFNGESSIALGVVKQSTANPLDVSDAVRAVLPELEQVMPAGMELAIAYDSSVFIKKSIEKVFHTIFEAVILVVLVIFLFLLSVRATLIPMVTIPISLIGAFAIMYFLGFSINTLTLLALVLAIGVVVDDAIVVLENVYRHIEQGLDPIHAAVKGMREITFAVIAMTLTLATVFAPVAFTPGRTGQLFTEFALTLAGAVLVSGFIALTLSPMMCSRMLKAETAPGNPISRAISWFLKGMDVVYEKILRFTLKVRWLIMLVAVGCMVLTGYLFSITQSELSPAEDRGVIFGVSIAPEGATLEYSDKYARQVEEIFTAVPETGWIFTAVGFPTITSTFVPVGFKPWDERERSALDIIAEASPQLFSIPGTLGFAINPPSLGQSATTRPVEFVIKTTQSYEELDVLVQQIMAKIAENPAIVGPDVDLKLNKPQLSVAVNRDKIATMGVEVDDIGRTLETMLAGRDVTRFKKDGEQYDVIVKIEDDERRDPNDLEAIFVRNSQGEMIKLSNIVTLQETVAPKELNHFDKLRSATIQANLAPGYSLGEALAFMEKTTFDVASNVQIDYTGVSREYKESSANLAITFILAISFIYLVLAAQFESFIDPLVILLTVPLAMLGALIAMTLTGGTLNVYSQIGLIALIGIISKHGIMMVEFANQLQDRGQGVHDAIVNACAIRLRPILMTTAAMVLGAIPLAIATGAGSETRQAIGWVIVGGMTIGTLFTLFVVPTFYTVLGGQRRLVEIDESRLVAEAHG